MVPGSTILFRDFHKRVQVESFDEVHFKFWFVRNHDFRCNLEAGSDTSMGYPIFPRLVLDFCRHLDGCAGCGMSPQSLFLNVV
jgi:hypothetical protein